VPCLGVQESRYHHIEVIRSMILLSNLRSLLAGCMLSSRYVCTARDMNIEI
jgi:hypothetical protein